MNIMLIDHYAGSVCRGMEFRPYYMAREWTKLGHKVVIVAASYSHLRQKNPNLEQGIAEETVDGIRYLWLKTPRYHGNGPGRAANIAAFCLKLARAARRLADGYHPDAVIASSTYPFDCYPASRIAKLSGGRFYFELHDLWPLTQIELYGLSEKNPYVRLLQRGEDFAYRNARRIISVLPDAYIHMEERGVSRDKFVYIPNGVIVGEDETPAALPPAQAIEIGKLRRQGKFVVLYLGGFATANALDELVEAAARMPDDIAVVLIGSGSHKAGLVKQAGSHVHFFDPVPKAQVQQALSQADCLYIGAKRCGLYRYGMGMNKLYDYMLSAKPVICGIEAPDNEVKKSGCGITIPAQDVSAIVNSVKRLKAMPEEQRIRMGERGRRYVLQNRDYALLAAQFSRVLTQ